MSATTLAVIATRAERGGNPPGGSALQRVHHHHHLHQVVVGRRTSGLQHKHILATHILEELHHHLTVRETPYLGAAEMNVQALRDICSKLRIGIAGKHHQAVVGHVQPLKESKTTEPTPRTLALAARFASLTFASLT